MAEAVDDGRSYGDDTKIRSLKGLGLSDQLSDPWCEQCYDHSDQKVDADGFCTECNNFLCKPCVEGHRKVAVLRNHRIRRGSKMPKSQAEKPVKHQDCDTHVGNVNDQFCVDHGTMVCSQCIREGHQHCKTKDISFPCKNLGYADFQHLKATISELKQNVVSTKSTLEGNITEIADQKKQMIKEAENMRDKLVKEIQNLCLKTVSTINDVCRQKGADINGQVSALSDVADSFDQTIKDIDKTIIHANFGPNQFIRLQYIVKRAQLCRTQIEDERKDLHKIHLSFSSAAEISDFLSKCKQLGNVSEVSSEVDTLKQLPEIIFPRFQGPTTRIQASGKQRDIMKINTTKMTPLNAKTSKDTDSYHIWGMDVTSNGTLLLADYYYNSIKTFTSDSKLLSSLPLSGRPCDITVIDDKTAAVCTSDKKLDILDISDPASPSVQRSVPLQDHARAVTTCNNRLVVMSWGVKMIDLNGKELWSTYHKGQRLFSDPRSVITTIINNKTIIIVSDLDKDTLTVLDSSNGNLVRTIDVKGKGPRGLTTDDDGNVYVCYFKTREICV